jgi:hypothetical protein
VTVASETERAGEATGAVQARAVRRTGGTTDPIVEDPQEAYRGEIREALIDAMLEHSRGLELGQGDWLVLAVRRNVERPQLAAADTDATTMMIRLKGSDLSAFLGGQISRAEARQRMDVRVF